MPFNTHMGRYQAGLGSTKCGRLPRMTSRLCGHDSEAANSVIPFVGIDGTRAAFWTIVLCGTIALCAALALPGKAVAQSPDLRGEFRVNTQELAQIFRNLTAAPLSNGGFVVVWEEYSRASRGDGRKGLFGRVYDEHRAAVGPEFQINTSLFSVTSGGRSNKKEVLGLDGGGFVVVWDTNPAIDGSLSGVFGQRFDTAGTPLGTEFQVNTYTTGCQERPGAAATSDGGFVVVWRSGRLPNSGSRCAVSGPEQDGDGSGGFGQRYDANGVKAGSEFQVTSYTTGSQSASTVYADSPSGFTVIWWGTDGPAGSGVYATRYDASGIPLGPATLRPDLGSFRVARMPSGGYMGIRGRVEGIFAQRLDSNGVVMGTEFQVNSYTTGTRLDERIALDGAGGFFVVWLRNTTQEGRNYYTAAGRHFDASVSPTGPEFELSSIRTEPASFGSPGIALHPDGGALATWSSFIPRGGLTLERGLRARHLCVGSGPDADQDGLSDNCDPCINDGAGDFIPGAKLKLSRINVNKTGLNDRLTFGGEFALPAGASFASFDPTTLPVRIVLEAGSGEGRVAESLPAASFGGPGTAGWELNSKGTRWGYKDKAIFKRNGIRRILLKDVSNESPGRVKVRISGAGGMYPFYTGDDPVKLLITVGDGAAGECGETAFTPADCSFNSRGDTLKCRS